MALHGGALVVASTGSPGQFATLGVNTAVTGAEVLSALASASIASAVSAVWDGVHFTAATATLSGSTAITTVTGFNTYTIEQPTISAASSLAVTIGATLTIKGIPIASGAGPATLTTGYGLWMQGTEAALAGTRSSIAVTQTFQDGGTTSTTIAHCEKFSPTINYTAASRTGKVALIYLAPTLTSQPSGNNAGIAFGSSLNSTTFQALSFNNVADEDTNFEKTTVGYSSNNFLINSTKGGSGTARSIAFAFSGTIKHLFQAGKVFLASAVAIAWDNADSFGTVPVQVVNTAQNGAQGWTWTVNGTLTSSPTDFNIETYSTALAGAFTATRLNVFNIQNVTGAATVTDMPLFRFDAAAGTHKSVNSGTTKTTPGAVTQWVVINVAGTLGYIPSYSSKTS